MEKRRGKLKTTTAKASQLGSNCWKAARFSGGECNKVKICPYPEKKTCEAHCNAVKIIPVIIFAKEAICQSLSE
jgi:hypothetical protein